MLDPMDFNPRSREGSDGECGQVVLRPVRISIHAPVKGATGPLEVGAIDDNISIHAPVKGATGRANDLCRVSHFNPRSREGSDVGIAQTVYTIVSFQSTLP